MPTIQQNLAHNLKRLRQDRNLSQQQMAELSNIPRPTWASLETGTANPTLTVLNKAANALNVSIEELVGVPRNEFELVAAADIGERRRQGVTLRPLVPAALPGLEISRMAFEPGGRMVGIPHTAGTREYLTCERGRVTLIARGEHYELGEGDMLVFRGDQKHSYFNPDAGKPAVAISVVCFAG